MESQPQNPEFRIDPENFHPCLNDKRRKILSIDNTYSLQQYSIKDKRKPMYLKLKALY